MIAGGAVGISALAVVGYFLVTIASAHDPVSANLPQAEIQIPRGSAQADARAPRSDQGGHPAVPAALHEIHFSSSTPIACDPGRSVTLGRASLALAQSGATPDELIYKLTVAPAHGWLRRDCLPLVAGATFSQADVDDDRISYEAGDLAMAGDAFQVSAMGLQHGTVQPTGCPIVVRSAGADQGLIAWYSFEEGVGDTVADRSGHGNTGTLRHATWTAGPLGTAVTFDGHGGMDGGNAALTRPSQATTLSGWVRTTQRTSDASVFRHDGYFTPLQVLFGKSWVSLWSNNSWSKLEFAWNGVLATGTWHHFAASYGASSGLKVYVDGHTYASNDQLRGPLASGTTSSFLIGNSENGKEPYFGDIDEVRIYDRVLEPGEIRLLAQQAAPVISHLDGGTAAYVTGGPAVTLDGAKVAAVSDQDDLCFAGGGLLVELANPLDGDLLGINAAGAISATGQEVSFQGKHLGLISTTHDGAHGHSLEITFDTQIASPEAVSNLIHALAYSSSAPTVEGSRTVRIRLSDGVLTSLAATVVVTITP